MTRMRVSMMGRNESIASYTVRPRWIRSRACVEVVVTTAVLAFAVARDGRSQSVPPAGVVTSGARTDTALAVAGQGFAGSTLAGGIHSHIGPLAILAAPGSTIIKPDDCARMGSADRDADGVCDMDDNCPQRPNADQADADRDQVGDACDACTETEPGTLVNIRGCPVTPGDFDLDADVDHRDYELFLPCITGPEIRRVAPECLPMDLDRDGDVDQSDFAVFQRCISGSGIPAESGCAG